MSKENWENQEDLKKLAEKLSFLSVDVIDDDKKSAIKQNLFLQINSKVDERIPFSLFEVGSYVRHFVKDIDFSSIERARIKEKVLDAIEEIPQRHIFITNFFMFSRKFVSVCLIAFMFITMLSFVHVDTSVVRAATFTELDSFSGEVKIERDGVLVFPELGMKIYENDKIITGEDGIVVIRYFDDSLTRLSSNSTLIVSKLNSVESRFVESYVEVELITGNVWSRVVNLVGDNASFVVKADDVVATAKKAAFNVSRYDNEVHVDVFGRSVDVQNNDNFTKVISGHTASFNDEIVVEKISIQGKEEMWVVENLEEDAAYLVSVEERLIASKLEAMGIDSIKDIDYENSVREDITLFLTFNDVSRQMKELDLIEQDFVSAQAVLAAKDSTDEAVVEAKKILISFASEVERFEELVEEVGYTDVDYSAELNEYLDDKVLLYKKELSVVSKDSPLYEAKILVDDLLVNVVADGEVEVVEERIDQLNDKLYEIETLAQKEDMSMIAGDVLKEYEKDAQEIVGAIVELNVSGDDDVVDVISDFEEVEEYYDVVFSIESGINVNSELPVSSTTASRIETRYGITVNSGKPLPPGLDF